MRRPKFGKTLREKARLSEKTKRGIKAAGGVGLIAVGIPLIPFPLPIGGVVTAAGVVMLTKNSDTARKGLDHILKKYPDLPRKYRSFSSKARAKLRARARSMGSFGKPRK